VKNIAVCLAVLVALSSTACRQPDGPLPTATDEETTNRLYDLSRDLEEVSRGSDAERQGFVDDLLVFADPHRPEALEAVRRFGTQLVDAVPKNKLSLESTQQLVRTCWTLVAATQLSDRQVKQIQEELGPQLTAIGVPQDRVDALLAELPGLQRAISTRPRRWYEVL
jgi:hypothetical protein